MRRKSATDLKEELRAIYAGQDGEIPDMTKLEKRRSSGLTRFLIRAILFLLVLSALAWGGFFLWSRGGLSPSRPLDISTEAPADIKAGQEAFYTFRYGNAGNAPIASLEMKLTLPPEFTMTSANPEPTEGLTWKLDPLSRGSDGAITIGGLFRSEVLSTETMQALFTYRPANFSSDFQDIETLKVEVNGSVLNLAVSGPENALPGDEVTYVVNVQNLGSLEATDVLVSFEPPDGFATANAEPAMDEFWSNAWLVPSMQSGELKAFTVKGRYTSSVSGEQKVKATASFLNADKFAFHQAEGEAQTDVLGGALAFRMVANGSAENQTVDPGDNLRLSIDYANNGNETIRSLSFTLALQSDTASLPINWDAADLGGGERIGNSIVWDENSRPEFLEFSPSTSGVIDLTLPVDSALTAGMAGQMDLILSASLAGIGTIGSPRNIDTSPVRVLVNSDFRASAHARYYTPEGETVGSGPLPPQVGQTTTYQIVWRVANSFHALESVRMTANLPPDVRWTGQAAAGIGTIAFDETTRIVTWNIEAMPKSVPGSEATFGLAIVPEQDDVGAFFKLTNAIAVSATDTFTKDQLTHGIDILTTELPQDKEAAGKGVVVE